MRIEKFTTPSVSPHLLDVWTILFLFFDLNLEFLSVVNSVQSRGVFDKDVETRAARYQAGGSGLLASGQQCDHQP